VQYITDEGFLHLEPIGGVDPVVATSQRVSIMTRRGLVPGVIGRKAIHLMDDEDKKKVPKIHDLYIDIGAKSKQDALKVISIGDAGIFVQPYLELANQRAVSMAFDNKMGTWIVTETLRLLHRRQLGACVIGVSTVQEKSGCGARRRAHSRVKRTSASLSMSRTAPIRPASRKSEPGISILAKGR
jgi:Cellulase M and related proteins